MQTVYSPVWRVKFQVRSSDIGYHGMMRVSNLCSYLQEVAGQHAEHLNVGYSNMQASGLAWVLTRLSIEIHKFPAWGEEFSLETWPLANERILYRRDFRLDTGNETCITASSYWIPLDLKTRRPRVVPIDDSVLKANAGRFGIDRPFESIQAVNGDHTEAVTVKYSDLDKNRHVNNARYVEWVFDHLGLDTPGNGVPRFFTIEYKQEVRPGDVVYLKRCKLENEDTWLVEGTLARSGRTALRAGVEF
jgi:medium-chain acyl-[acyl-carrier-protein] hydrolase